MDHSSRLESAIHMAIVSMFTYMERHRKYRAGIQCIEVQHSIPCHHPFSSQFPSL